MNQNKFKTLNKMDRDFKHDARQLTKVFDKETKSYIFNVSDIKIKMSQDRVKLYLMKKIGEKLITDLCMKHALISRATDVMIPKIDSCRVISDPFGNEILLNFKSPSIASEYETQFLKNMKVYNKKYANICFDVNVTNLVNVEFKKSAKVSISGLTLGKELKSWIEQEFEFPDIHMPCYILQISVGAVLLTIRDDTTILQVYEHINYSLQKGHCFFNCFHDSVNPKSTISILINYCSHTIVNKTNKIPYSIEEKWGVGEMPKWLTRLLADIYFDGPDSKGVFRISAKDSTYPKWYKYMLDCEDFIISEDIYNKAAIFKFFLRSINGSLMTKTTRKQLNSFGKKFMQMKFKKCLENSKNQSNFIKLFHSLPKTHLFLFQNILIVLNAIIDNPNSEVDALAISRAIAPSIFPLIRLKYCKYSSDLLEAAIYLTDEIVKPADKMRIIDFYNTVRTESNNLTNQSKINNTIFSDNDSITLSSINESDSKLQNINSCDKLSDYEFEKDSDLENFSQDSVLSDNVSSSDIESDSSNRSCDYSTDNRVKIFPQANSEKHLESNDESSKLQNAQNVCMGLKMKQIYRSCSKFTESEDHVKEILSPVLRNEKKTVGQRHKSLIVSDSMLKAFDRNTFEFIESESTIDRDNIKENYSPALKKETKPVTQRHKSLIQSVEGPSAENVSLKSSIIIGNSTNSVPIDVPIKRKCSRKALAAVSELNNSNNNNSTCDNTNHRSRSPFVKKLIRLYENKKY